MNTSAINHRLATVVTVAVTACAGVLSAAALTSADAAPEPKDPPVVTDRSVDTDGHYVNHACFITPLTWHEGLDGPLPRCYTYVS